MRNDIVGLAQQYAQQKAQTAAKRIAVPAAFGLVAAVFFLIVVIALFASAICWLGSECCNRMPSRQPAKMMHMTSAARQTKVIVVPL